MSSKELLYHILHLKVSLDDKEFNEVYTNSITYDHNFNDLLGILEKFIGNHKKYRYNTIFKIRDTKKNCNTKLISNFKTNGKYKKNIANKIIEKYANNSMFRRKGLVELFGKYTDHEQVKKKIFLFHFFCSHYHFISFSYNSINDFRVFPFFFLSEFVSYIFYLEE